MELRHLRYFVAVAEELNFGRAAKSLKISQPPLSRAIRRLEAELGVRLLERSRQSAVLTFAGRLFARQARQILADVESSASFIRRKHGTARKVTVGYVRTAHIRILPRILKEFCRVHPDIEIRIHPLTTEEQIQALRESRIDVGVVRLPASGGGVTVERLIEEPSFVALPEAHPLSRRLNVPTASLHRLRVFRMDRPAPKELPPTDPEPVCPKLTLVTGDFYDELGVVAAGMGAVYVPESLVDVRHKGVIYRPADPDAPPFRTGLAFRKGRGSPEQAAFVRIARRVHAGLRHAGS